jgi:hypothetical protein
MSLCLFNLFESADRLAHGTGVRQVWTAAVTVEAKT